MISNLEKIHNELIVTHQLTMDAIAQAQTEMKSDKFAVARIKIFCDYAIRHVSVQSEGFYRILKAHHHGNSSALKKIGFFEDDLKELRVNLFVFIEKYFSDKPVRNMRPLIADFKEISENILNRINVENSQLLPLFCL